METKTLGEKIEYFRKRAKMSQLDLELEIEAGQGSLSRIENNQVNPTKETLSKIANTLKLKPSEISDLLGLNILSTEELILAIQSFSASLDLNTTLQTAVDIMFGLFPNYNGGIIFLKDESSEDTFRARTISHQIPNLDKFLNLLPFRLDEMEIKITEHKNLSIDTLVNKRNNQSFDLFEFANSIVNKFISDSIQTISGFQSGITIPMIFNKEVIGMVFFTKRIKEEFNNNEIKILELLTNQIAISIINAKKYEELKKEVELLKKQSGN